jgi:hypothetical protein
VRHVHDEDDDGVIHPLNVSDVFTFERLEDVSGLDARHDAALRHSKRNVQGAHLVAFKNAIDVMLHRLQPCFRGALHGAPQVLQTQVPTIDRQYQGGHQFHGS